MALVPGSIAFTGFNADGNDGLAFVALAAIPPGTTIFFSDREWTGSGFNVVPPAHDGALTRADLMVDSA